MGVPGAAQRVFALRCRPGTFRSSAFCAVPDQRCTASAFTFTAPTTPAFARSRCTASGTLTVKLLDIPARLVLAVGAGAALYLIAVPLAMLLLSAFRGPADYLPFEPGARWTLEHVRALVSDPVLYSRILPG